MVWYFEEGVWYFEEVRCMFSDFQVRSLYPLTNSLQHAAFPAEAAIIAASIAVSWDTREDAHTAWALGRTANQVTIQICLMLIYTRHIIPKLCRRMYPIVSV